MVNSRNDFWGKALIDVRSKGGLNHEAGLEYALNIHAYFVVILVVGWLEKRMDDFSNGADF
jgi:hypothetical protein